EIDPANAIVADIANQQPAFAIKGDTMRLSKLRLRRGPAVAAKSCNARAGDRGNDMRLGIDAAHYMALHLGKEEVAGTIEADFVWLVQQRIDGRAAVARVPFRARSDNGSEGVGLQIQAPDAV